MCQHQRQRHIILGFVCCKTEHHSLVAGTLILRILALYPLIDIWRLLVNSGQNSTTISIKHVLTLGVSNFGNNRTSDFLNIQVRLGFYLPSQYYLTCCNQRLTSNFTAWIISQEIIYQRVRNLIGYFIRMTFGY